METSRARRLKTILSRPISLLVLLLFLVQAALLFVPRSDGHLLSADGGYYYSYMRSIVLDGDVNVDNDIALYNARVPKESTGTLQAWYAFSIGPALLWSPFFVVGHAVALLAHVSGANVVADGYSGIEEGFVAFGSVAYCALALILLLRVVKRIVPNGSPEFAVIGVFLASPAIYYAIFEPTMSHTLELFSCSLFLWLLFDRPLQRHRDFLLLGGAAGLMFLVRWQDVIFVVVALPLIFGRRPFEGRRITLVSVASFLAGALPVAFLQLLFWKLTFGSFFVVPQGPEFLTLGHPHILEVLFSTKHGLFLWNPALIFGLLGLAFLRNRLLACSFALAFILAWGVCSVAGDWWGGDAFGLRRMIGTLPFLMVGVAALFSAIRKSRLRKMLITLIVLLCIWNFAFMVQYRLGLIPRCGPLSFREMVTDKFSLPITLLRKAHLLH